MKMHGRGPVPFEERPEVVAEQLAVPLRQTKKLALGVHQDFGAVWGMQLEGGRWIARAVVSREENRVHAGPPRELAKKHVRGMLAATRTQIRMSVSDDQNTLSLFGHVGLAISWRMDSSHRLVCTHAL